VATRAQAGRGMMWVKQKYTTHWGKVYTTYLLNYGDLGDGLLLVRLSEEINDI